PLPLPACGERGRCEGHIHARCEPAPHPSSPAAPANPPSPRCAGRGNCSPSLLSYTESVMTAQLLPSLLVEPLVRAALLEDLRRAGDLTTDAIVPAEARTETALVARQPGVVAGLAAAELAFKLVDSAIRVQIERPDGSRLAKGDLIATVAGPARGI